jgi:hypothetical protein
MLRPVADAPPSPFPHPAAAFASGGRITSAAVSGASVISSSQRGGSSRLARMALRCAGDTANVGQWLDG